MSKVIDDIVSSTGMGRPFASMTDLLWGFDHRGAGTAFPKNTADQGLIFVTRPRLNLSYDNIITNRKMSPLLSDDLNSPHRAIRCLLDPVVGAELKSNLVDVKQAFFAIMTGTCLTATGWQEGTLEMFTSAEGVRREVYSLVDSTNEINGAYTLTLNFANTKGHFIPKIFQFWGLYMGGVKAFDLVPYPDQSMQREVDYQSRIWRIVLSEDKRFVEIIGCANICVPTADPTGAFMDYNRADNVIRNMDQISIPFHCLYAEYDDPILLEEFNLTVCLFNSQMRDGTRESTYRKMTQNELNKSGNYKGYPRIDLVTRELEWWI
jgi:hypothetical protein